MLISIIGGGFTFKHYTILLSSYFVGFNINYLRTNISSIRTNAFSEVDGHQTLDKFL